MRKLLPAKSCVVCDRTLKQIGGQRIVATQRVGIIVERKFGRQRKKGETILALSRPRGHYVRFWGKVIQELSFEAIAKPLTNDRHPWLCQQCAGVALCTKCGAPLTFAHGADVLDDNGKALHQMIVPASLPCSNPGCEDSRENAPAKDDE